MTYAGVSFSSKLPVSKCAVPSPVTHGLLSLTHLSAALVIWFVLDSDEYKSATQEIEARGSLPLWLQLNASAYSEWTQSGNTLPNWSTFDKFEQDLTFHEQNLTICSADNDDEEQFEQCSDTSLLFSGSCNQEALTMRHVVIMELESDTHTINFPGGFRRLFVLYFATSWLHHLPLAVPYTHKQYMETIESKLCWGARWIEYAFSASLMSLVLLLLNGKGTPESVVQTIVITSLTMLCGFAIEVCDGLRSRLHDSYKPTLTKFTKTITPDIPAFIHVNRDNVEVGVPDSELPARCATLESDSWIQTFGQEPNKSFPGSPLPPRTQTTSLPAWWLQSLTWCLFLCAGLAQLFGLWLHPWLWRYDRTMDQVTSSLEAQFPGNVCNSGPPAYVGFAIRFVIVMYGAFAGVMFWRIQAALGDAGYAKCVEVTARSEFYYAALSLLSKVGLMAVFVWGVTQRSKCEIMPGNLK